MQSTKQSIFFHERPIVDLKFHRDGDVFFAASKDCSATMMNLEGRILGSFDGHSGAISTIDSFRNSFLTAGTDLLLIKWDVFTGMIEDTIHCESVVRGTDFGEQIYFCTDNSMNREAIIGMVDPKASTVHKVISLSEPSSKMFKIDDKIIFAMANGKVGKLDLRNQKIIQEAKVHQSKITDMKPSACRSFFATSSMDSSAKIIDVETFAVKKRFDSEEPINSVSIFNTNDIVVCVGGINARDVTITRGKSSFDTNFFDIVTQQKIGYFTTHFGTINAVDVHPQSTHYISGGEDSSVCLVKLSADFKEAPFTKLS